MKLNPSEIKDCQSDRGNNDLLTLQKISISPIPFSIAKKLIEPNHYLGSLPPGTQFYLGVFLDSRLLGAVTLGAGPYLGYKLVDGASPDDAVTLTRLWLSDELPRNSESRVLGMILRSLRQNTRLKFILAYSDPEAGHQGTIYQATNWLHIGLSTPMPLYDLGDGVGRHSRTVAQILGSHSVNFLNKSCDIKVLPQTPKFRYIYFLDPSWRSRLSVPVLPYPKGVHCGDR